MQVVDLSGKVVFANIFENATSVDFENFQSGIYFVEIAVAGNRKVMKVVKR
jgi:hypothetical protein